MNNRTWTIMLFTVLFVQAIPALSQESPQLLFDRGNDALVAGEYRQALNAYNRLLENKQVSGAMYLNMGISYVRLDSLGKAKYFFLKASRFDETEKNAKKGLEYVEQRFSRQSAILPKLPWDKAVDWLKLNVGASTLLGIGIIFLNFGVVAYVSTWFWAPYQKPLQQSGIGAAAIGLILTVLSFYVQYVSQRYSEAVMIHRQANVVEKPADDASVVSQAYEGYTFTVDTYESETHPGWSYVRMSNGLYGWIPNREIMVL